MEMLGMPNLFMLLNTNKPACPPSPKVGHAFRGENPQSPERDQIGHEVD